MENMQNKPCKEQFLLNDKIDIPLSNVTNRKRERIPKLIKLEVKGGTLSEIPKELQRKIREL